MVAIHQITGFSLSDENLPYAEQVDVNGNKGFFQEWIDSGEVDKMATPLLVAYLNGYKMELM